MNTPDYHKNQDKCGRRNSENSRIERNMIIQKKTQQVGLRQSAQAPEEDLTVKLNK